jgi:hypothetical protein
MCERNLGAGRNRHFRGMVIAEALERYAQFSILRSGWQIGQTVCVMETILCGMIIGIRPRSASRQNSERSL